MSERRVDPVVLAGRVADGQPVDWQAALDSTSDDRERRVIHHLRLVESVARIHRSVGASPPEPFGSLASTATMSASPTAGPAPPRRSWAHLELREKLGEGAFGEVYRAWDPRLDREVALKLLKLDGSRRERLASTVIAEARLLAKLRHPNVVTVFGAEVHDGRVGMWMELIRGRSLQELLRDQGPFGAREAALIGIDLCRALAAVHGAGVVHRDVKAENVLREEGGRILLTDFGAGIEVQDEQGPRDEHVSGTPLYMAPELFRGAPATQRSDIYSLGVLLHRLVTGSFPLQAGSWRELRDKHARQEAQLLRDVRTDLPEPFVKVVERAVDPNPGTRFATAGRMEQALSLALGMEGAPVPAEPAASRHRVLAFGAAGLLAAAAVVAGLLLVPSVTSRRGPAPAAGGAERAGAAPALSEPGDPAGAAAYTVHAAVYRAAAGSSQGERIGAGARLVLGDRLTLEFRASRPLHVYVLNEDEEGRAYALFPLPGFDLRNPLSAGATHVLPGSRDGQEQAWTVDSAGGREYLMVLASPMRLDWFEAEMSGLARPGQAAALIPDEAKLRLRGIGGLSPAPAAGGRGSAGRLFEMAGRLASRSEVVEGVWLRRIELENPRPE